MARRRSILDSLTPVDEPPTDPQETATAPETPAAEDQGTEGTASEAGPDGPATEPPAKPARSSRKTTPRKATERSSSTSSQRSTGTNSAPSRRRAAAAPAAAESDDGDDDGAPRPLRIRKVTTAEASKQMIYMHPDEFRALGLARLDDHVSVNIRVRAMIALWEANPRFRRAVDKIAVTTPRGGG